MYNLNNNHLHIVTYLIDEKNITKNNLLSEQMEDSILLKFQQQLMQIWKVRIGLKMLFQWEKNIIFHGKRLKKWTFENFWNHSLVLHKNIPRNSWSPHFMITLISLINVEVGINVEGVQKLENQ